MSNRYKKIIDNKIANFKLLKCLICMIYIQIYKLLYEIYEYII